MSKRYRVEYSPEALDDLRAVCSYIAFHLKERETAAGQVGRIRQEIRSLCELPERYAAVDWEPWASMGMRKLSIGKYVVYYWTDQDSRLVSIARIFYGGRDVESIVSAE